MVQCFLIILSPDIKEFQEHSAEPSRMAQALNQSPKETSSTSEYITYVSSAAKPIPDNNGKTDAMVGAELG